MTFFTAADYRDRIRRSQQALADAGLSGLLVTPGPDMAYFLGASPRHVSERATILVIPQHGEPTLVVPTLECDALREALILPVEVLSWTDSIDPYPVIVQHLNPQGRYAVTDSAWSMHVLALQQERPSASFTSCTRALPMLRAIKSPDEIALLTAAGAANDAVFHDVLTLRFAGRSENDLAATIAGLLRDHGHEQVDFTIVASGPHGANPHHEGSTRRMQDGDLVVLDFGGLVNGYGSDMTRMVHIGDRVSTRHREMVEVVIAAQQAGVDAVQPGASCQDVDRAARAVITEAGWGEFFIHRTGHGIGMTTHEPPYMVEGESSPIVAGMCFSVEPGVYLPGDSGARIEDIVVAFPDHSSTARRLNHAPRALSFVQ